MIRQTTKKTNARDVTSEALSLLTLGIALFIAAALLSYDVNDPSLFTNSDATATNACGWVGAYLAGFLLLSIGIGAFLVPVALLSLSMILYRREGLASFAGVISGMTGATLALGVFLTLQWPYLPYGGQTLLTGGAAGAWLAGLLKQHFNPLGSSMVSLMIFFITLVISTPLSVVAILNRVAKTGTKVAARVARGVLAATFFALLTASQWVGKNGLLAARRIGAEWKARKKNKEDSSLEPQLEPECAPSPIEDAVLEPTLLLDTELDREELDEFSIQDIKTSTIEIEPLLKPQTQATTPAPPKRPKASRQGWKLPTIEFLSKPPKVESHLDRDRLIENSKKLERKFRDFGIEGEVTAVRPGPVITLYEFKPGPGIKVSRIAALSDDLSMALSAESVRILAPLPGKAVVGIEIPSEHREKVVLREFLQHPDFFGAKTNIPVVMGKDIGGAPVLSDLARMPHLLCAGQTGSGKSVFMNSLICSLLYRFTPDELRLILVDPKFIEFRAYQDTPHLLLPVVDDPKNASTTLKWAVREMERRYRILAMMGVRNLAAYNTKVEEMGDDVVTDLLHAESKQDTRVSKAAANDWIQAYEPDESGQPKIGKLPYIVIIIDELADLMMVARKEVEISIARVAQKARAAGIHLVIATQRPSTDVITGLIKANLPSRVSFKLASHVDSKTILDRAGAERLLGQGDMLFVPPGTSQIQRLHGAFVDDDEIHKITAFLKAQGEPLYRDEILTEEDEESDPESEVEQDELFEQAVELVQKTGHASASFLQRHLKVGYNRAARMIEAMEGRGLVGPADGARPREVLL